MFLSIQDNKFDLSSLKIRVVKVAFRFIYFVGDMIVTLKATDFFYLDQRHIIHNKFWIPPGTHIIHSISPFFVYNFGNSGRQF